MLFYFVPQKLHLLTYMHADSYKFVPVLVGAMVRLSIYIVYIRDEWKRSAVPVIKNDVDSNIGI
jgi:hypothetical protein